MYTPARRASLPTRLIGVALAALMASALFMGGGMARAAPVTGSQSDAAESVPAHGAQPGSHSPPRAGASPDVSTGNRNLDILLDMQGRAEMAARAASRPASSQVRVTVPTPNTNLSGGVMNEIRAAQAAKAAPNRELLGMAESGLQAKPTSPDATQKREWSGQMQSGSIMSGVGRGDGAEGEPSRARLVEEPEAMRVLRETIDWMRQNRWEVLGMLLGVVGLYALIRFYTRRPEG